MAGSIGSAITMPTIYTSVFDGTPLCIVSGEDGHEIPMDSLAIVQSAKHRVVPSDRCELLLK